MNVLIVDDRPTNLKLLHFVLESDGHTVCEARDGVEALVVLNREPVDAVISDILMPRMDGYRLCDEVRRSEKLRDIPFIFYTATYTSPGDEKLCLDLGGDKYLRKPASAADVLGALHEVMERSKSRASRPTKKLVEAGVMKEYNEQLVVKLEEKHLELEQRTIELRHTQQRLLHLLEHSPAVIYALRIEGEKITPYLVSENITRLLGFTVTETLSYEWWMGQLHPDDRDRAMKSLAETLANGESRTEYKIRHKSGTVMWVDDNRRLIRNAAGEPAEFIGVWTDITEKKTFEAQFLRAQRMESIGTLAGGIAHDLNNILAPIMMSIEILKTTSEHPQATRILETIEVSAKRGADIVRQVLSFARGVEGERVEVQPKHLLRDLEGIIKDTFPKDIRMQFSVPNETWTILGDPTQVHQVLLNLCVNARDAMPNGGSLTVEVENCVLDEHYAAMNIQAKPGRYVVISVTDSGTGIPPGILGKIFEPFFTTKELNKGTGLGLSTVMAIVKSHDGIINVYSEPGKGAAFKVYLPAMEISSEARKEQSRQASLPRGNGETVLLVDDEASILTIASQTLQAFGYRVLTATDGAEALAIYLQHKNEIAVVLIDMMMPVMDGPAAIHALTRINPAIKIIAASGLNANGGVAKVSGAGVKHFLTKPYTAGTLLKTIRAILDVS